MDFMGLLIPDIPADERALLKKIRSKSANSEKFRDIAYAVMNQTLRGANLGQKDGVALKELSSSRDDKQVGPITIYSNALDSENQLELAIHPTKLADALNMKAADTQAWLDHLQANVGHWATPKTSFKYERVGIRDDHELRCLLVSWKTLISNRSWPPETNANIDPTIGVALNVGSSTSSIDIANFERTAQKTGFDRSVAIENGWLVFRSKSFGQSVGLVFGPDGSYRLAISDQVVGRKIATECAGTISEAPTPWQFCIDGLSLNDVHRLIGRVATISSVVGGQGILDFSAQTPCLPDTTEVLRVVAQRVGQDIFRNSLLGYWGGCCAVTGLAVGELLRASHIKPWADCTSDVERLDVFNGLLLAPHLDALFDGGWVTFLDSGCIEISDALDMDNRARLNVTGEEVIAGLAAQHGVYLAWHREHRFRRTPEPTDRAVFHRPQ